MTTLAVSSPPAAPAPASRWQRLLRVLELEAWFRRVPALGHGGHEERVLLLLALTNAPVRWPEPLAAALAASLPAIRASGGEVVPWQVNQVLLSWPAAQPAAALAAYEALRAHLARQVGEGPQLYGAATLGWVARRARAGYRGAVLGQVAGILHEGRALGSPLLLSAALRDRLGVALRWPCALHVGLRVPGHRYPATLYRVAAHT